MSKSKDKKRERLIDRRQKTNVSDPFAQDFSSVFSELLQASEEGSSIDNQPLTMESDDLESVSDFDAKTEVSPDMVSRAERIETIKRQAEQKKRKTPSQRQPISELPATRKKSQRRKDKTSSRKRQKPVPRGALPAGARRIEDEKTQPSKTKRKAERTKISARMGGRAPTEGEPFIKVKHVAALAVLGLIVGGLFALILYKKPVSEFPERDEAKAYLAAGNEYYQNRDMENALRMYRKASSVYPEYLAARKAEANLLSQLGQNEAAVKAFERYLKLDKKSTYAQFAKDNLGQYRAEKKNIEKKQKLREAEAKKAAKEAQRKADDKTNIAPTSPAN